MKFYAHKNNKNEMQTIYNHLVSVANISNSFAADMFKSAAFCIGIAHDIGKYSVNFQKRLMGSAVKYEHSACGAIEYYHMTKNDIDKLMFPMIEYCISGHHTGLPDGGTAVDTSDDPTLYGKLSREKFYTGDSDYSNYKTEVELKKPDFSKVMQEIINAGSPENIIEVYAFFTRYLFSCLTDADFIDTEKFCSPEKSREMHADFKKALMILEKTLSNFTVKTPLQAARNRLQEQAYKNAENNSNISILTMPTGSGKTLCSLKIAFQKLLSSKGSKKRIIYVIPYTSIIEQTAELFENIIGKYVDILQHHSNYCYDENTEDQITSEKMKRSSENWDAPIVITTSVQFFESLYHFRSSKLRKLHNLADSIIVFDEIHMIPTEYLQPCLRSIGYITKYLNSEAIFLSATMPDYSNLFNKYIPFSSVSELIKEKEDFQYFNKCDYVNLGRTDVETIINKASFYQSSLIIVNTKKAARDLFKLIQGNKYHLSTLMTPADRSYTIQKIKDDLSNGLKITVVSTSLIEAGVDLDFETVFRQIAGIDNILQSGGRCNREGKRKSGTVYIFQTNDTVSRDMQVRINTTTALLKEYDNILDPECIKKYYNTIFNFKEIQIESESIVKFVGHNILPDAIPFKQYAMQFEFIKDDSIGVVISNCDECNRLIEELKMGKYSAKRKLQKYTVSLKFFCEFNNAYSAGIITDFGQGLFVLNNNYYYDNQTGLDINKSMDIIC